MKALFGAAVVALMLAGCGEKDGGTVGGNGAGPVAGPVIAAPNGADWTETVIETAEGGFLMGNPDAPVKLVEYGSLTCSHCADFSETASEPLKNDFVKTGRVSWEFRPYLLFPTDPGISMLLRCQGAGPFFALTEQLYADQRTWVGRLQGLSEADATRIQSLPPAGGAAAYVQAAQLDQYFRERGMPQARIDSCLADRQGLEKLAAIKKLADSQGLTGTPTFLINDRRVDNVADWRTLRPKIEAALN